MAARTSRRAPCVGRNGAGPAGRAGRPRPGRALPLPPAGRAGRRLGIGGCRGVPGAGRTQRPGPPRTGLRASRGASAASRLVHRQLAAASRVRPHPARPGWGRRQSVLGPETGCGKGRGPRSAAWQAGGQQAGAPALLVSAARRPGRRRRPAPEAGRGAAGPRAGKVRRARAGGRSWAGWSWPGARAAPSSRGLRGQRTLAAPPPLGARGTELSNGISTFSSAPPALEPPFPAQLRRCCCPERLGGPEPGHRRSQPLPVRLCPRWARRPCSGPRARGRASASFLSPRRGGKGPPSPRQVREGCVDSFSCGEQVAPKAGPFCSLYFILKLYLMLLYERGGAGRELSRPPLRANVLFIMRKSEISCEAVEEGLGVRAEGMSGAARCLSGPRVCSSH